MDDLVINDSDYIYSSSHNIHDNTLLLIGSTHVNKREDTNEEIANIIKNSVLMSLCRLNPNHILIELPEDDNLSRYTNPIVHSPSAVGLNIYRDTSNVHIHKIDCRRLINHYLNEDDERVLEFVTKLRDNILAMDILGLLKQKRNEKICAIVGKHHTEPIKSIVGLYS